MKKEVKNTAKCKNDNKPIGGVYTSVFRDAPLFFDLWSKVAQRNFAERIWR